MGGYCWLCIVLSCLVPMVFLVILNLLGHLGTPVGISLGNIFATVASLISTFYSWSHSRILMKYLSVTISLDRCPSPTSTKLVTSSLYHDISKSYELDDLHIA